MHWVMHLPQVCLQPMKDVCSKGRNSLVKDLTGGVKLGRNHPNQKEYADNDTAMIQASATVQCKGK